jgi:predicted HicB family RNase H-like nuclease
MSSNYKEILDQANKEKQRQAMEASNPASIQANKDDLVNLCVRVPKTWRTSIKAKAVQNDLTLEKLVMEAVNQYVEQQGW